jgi:indolepyruvate ferredoxin oxidoreductase beta subunit
MPHPGDVDIVIASEIMEAGRAVQRGIVTRDRTTLIASSNRVYAIGEKSHLADGRADDIRVAELAREHAKSFITLDMQAIATAQGSVISAVMLGALAGSGALPFARESYRKAIQQGGIAVSRSLAAFDAAAQAAQTATSSIAQAGDVLTWRTGHLAPQLDQAVQGVPETVRPVVAEGVRRLVDYQDASYARLYLERLAPFLDMDAGRGRLAEAVARGLALWMSFEDTIRVADLKIRGSRSKRVASEVAASANELVTVTEFMKPRVEEICGTLPARLGRLALGSPGISRALKRFTNDRQINTSKVGGYLLLYMLAGLRRWRRGTLRFHEEDARIQSWLAAVRRTALVDYELAVELAECQRLVKGYGSTHERGVRNFELVLDRAAKALGRSGAAQHVRALRSAATADEEGELLRKALAGWPDAGQLQA